MVIISGVPIFRIFSVRHLDLYHPCQKSPTFARTMCSVANFCRNCAHPCQKSPTFARTVLTLARNRQLLQELCSSLQEIANFYTNCVLTLACQKSPTFARPVLILARKRQLLHELCSPLPEIANFCTNCAHPCKKSPTSA